MARKKINPESGSYNHNTDPQQGYDDNHVIRLGSENAGNGDPLRTAMEKINEAFDKIDSNFTEVYTLTGGDFSQIDDSIIPKYDNTYDLGSPSNQWRDIYVSNGSIYIGDIKLSNEDGQLVVQQVTNPGEETEEPVPDAPGSVTTDRLVNGTNTFVLKDDGTVELNGEPFTGGSGSTGDFTFNGNILSTDVGMQLKVNSGAIDVTNGDYGWQFKDDGELKLPAGGDIVDSNGDSVLGGGGGTTTSLPYLELTNDPILFNPLVGESVTFTKEDYAEGEAATDFIDTNIAITRKEQYGIYNPFLEADWDNTDNDGSSPAGTLWNKDGWGDLTNLDQRIYLSFYETFLRFGNNVLAAEAVMKDVANDKYYKFDFTVWGNYYSGAPVTYTRTQINPGTGEPIGEPVEFVKAGYADPTEVNDPIDTNLTIARGNNQSIYNIALETSYSTAGDGEDSPEGTLWNADGWGTLRNVKQRSYVTFYEALGQAIGENILFRELVMWDTVNDKYWIFKFSSWTMGGNGGGFSYTRQQVKTSQLFVKTDYGDEVDVFIEDDGEGAGVGITRGENQGIFNPYREEGWDDENSPAGTLWNLEGWDDFSDVETRTYQPFYQAYGDYLGNRIVGTQAVMYIPDNGKYYAIQWLSWTQNNNGGGFSYIRYELNLEQLTDGVRFTDGTILRSAEGIGRVKSQASGNRRIEEAVGSKTVSVTEIVTQPTVTSSAYQDNSGNSNYINLVWEADLITQYEANNNIVIELSTDEVIWVGAQINGYSNGNWIGFWLQDNVLPVGNGDTVYYRIKTGGEPVVWWDMNDLPSGGGDFRGAVIDYHAYSGEATWIGTIHIVNDSGEEHISHTEVSSGSTDGENDDLWLVQNEGTISYRRIDGESKTLRVHWTAKVFYGSEYYD